MGSYAAIGRGWRADTCVIPEPTGLDLVPANAGSLTFRLLVPGRATHAARRMSGVSAVEKFWPIFRALREPEDRRNRNPDPLASRWQLPYPISIGSVRSGEWAPTVPDLLGAAGRLGVMLDEPVERARAEFEQAVAEASAGDPWLRATRWRCSGGEAPSSQDGSARTPICSSGCARPTRRRRAGVCSRSGRRRTAATCA